ncbi:hypothetical protein [Gallaecimonas xiamenensis]|uniref:Uncharacterized protein n=1 Tax=Gallaecimonas xiamenensis 3-C-1 TaxID=745411 RepID=K2JNT5_9GAMM|nr:hypothetical protein [Gallaecimonas xiamenensis]EKE76147.1 hypothetical protein B3C1_04545 [Gallaecimonas xiamenensis 3-C-1]
MADSASDRQALMDSLTQKTAELGSTTDKWLAPDTGPNTAWSPDLAITLSIIILVFGITVFGFMAHLIKKGHDANEVLRVCALPLIITSATFLIVVGYSQQQIAPVMGLLGTVAGYLLGNRNAKKGD